MTGAATANVRERRLTIHQVNRLIGLLARHLEALHQIKMPQRYWMGLLYWYAREAIDKQEQFLSLTIPPQYDGSSTKSHVLQRANPRLNRTFLNNLIDFQKFESYGKSWRMIRVLIPVLRELLHYGVFRIKNFRKRQTLRWKLNRSAIESRDPLLRQALRLMPEHLVEDFSFFSAG